MDFLNLAVSTALSYGGDKGLDKLGILAKNILDNGKFQNMFLEAGAEIARFEKDNSEECDIRKIVFCKENMLMLAKGMKSISGYEWSKTLDIYLDELLNKSNLSEEQKKVARLTLWRLLRMK